jgi:choline kinase
MKAVILAAGRGTRLAPLTDDRPKPLVEVGGRSLLLLAMDRLAEVGVAGSDVIVVTGYREDMVARHVADAGFTPTLVTNPRYADWQNFHSLLVARHAVAGEPFLQIDGDVLFDGTLLPMLVAAPGPGVLAVDVRPHLDDETMKVAVAAGTDVVVEVAKGLDPARSLGEFIGISRIDPPLAAEVWDELARFPAAGLTQEYYERAYNDLSRRGRGPFRALDVSSARTIEIDDLADLERAEALRRG